MSNTHSPYRDALAARISELIDRRGLTVEQVADAAGLYRMVLRRKLTGQAAFNTDEIAAVAMVLRVNPWNLLLVGSAV